MNEKVFRTMGRTGGGNIAMGVLLLVAGVTMGVLMIVNGATVSYTHLTLPTIRLV